MTSEGARQLSLTQREARFVSPASVSPDSLELPPLRTLGLFAGIGGIEKGLGAAGHDAVALCEIDDGATAVLEKHFPGVRLHRDICQLRAIPRGVDLVAAGFPCQDLSQAGQTAGITGSRSGLVGHVFRLLEKRRAPWVLIENVPFMLQLGKGRALEVIVGELERLGYRWAYRVVDTLAFGLPQRRERVFLLASRKGDPRSVLFADEAGEPAPRVPARTRAFGFYWTEGVRGLGSAIDAVPTLKGGSTIGIPSPPAIVLPRRDRIVTPDIRDAERLQGFEPDWTLPAQSGRRRTGHRWKLVGNAVTVDVARWIGTRLRSPGEYDSSWDQPLPRGSAWPTAAWSDGSRRYAVNISTWPVAKEGPPIDKFLLYEKRNLSARATTGFLGRLRSSSLRRPKWFEPVLESHLARMASRAR
jgi:DNA (cytosine-5)-methyltransferase 1